MISVRVIHVDQFLCVNACHGSMLLARRQHARFEPILQWVPRSTATHLVASIILTTCYSSWHCMIAGILFYYFQTHSWMCLSILTCYLFILIFNIVTYLNKKQRQKWRMTHDCHVYCWQLPQWRHTVAVVLLKWIIESTNDNFLSWGWEMPKYGCWAIITKILHWHFLVFYNFLPWFILQAYFRVRLSSYHDCEINL